MAIKTSNPAALAAVTLQLIEVDPTSLLVDDQVRGDATPDDDLIASVRQMGVLQPPTVFWDEERGAHVIVMGHRRVGAAIIAKLPTIQVLVRDAAEARDAARIERQLVENEMREELTPADVARGYKDMAMFGLRPEDIALRVADRPHRVKAAIAATESPAATEALAKGVDLEQAAIIAEFDDDPTAQKTLSNVAINQPADFNRRVIMERDARLLKVKRAELEQLLEDEGVELVGTVGYEAKYWRSRTEAGVSLSLEVLGITPDEHVSCPGHAAILELTYAHDKIQIAYVCTDVEGNGHTENIGIPRRELTDEERAAQEEREQRREAERKTQEAASANAKARREWLRGFITGRLNQTAGLFDFIAAATIGAAALDETHVHEADNVAIYILTGEEIPKNWDQTPLADMLAEGRVAPLRALTADALATAEEATRSVSQASFAPRLATAYFTALAAWGYELTEIDKQLQQAAADALAEEQTDGDDTAEDEQ